MKRDVTDLTDKAYRALPIESFSSMKYLLDSPDTFLYYKSRPFKGSDATLLGTAVHHYLQGNRHLVAINEISRITKAGKEAYAKFAEEFYELAGEEGIIVPKSFEEKLSTIAANFSTNPRVVQLMASCKFEVPYFFEVLGMQLKGRVDGVTHAEIVEIKTSSQATNITEFREEAKERHYDMQAASYLEGHFQAHGVRLKHGFVVVNTQAPFAVNYYPSGDEFLNEGKEKLYEAIKRYKKYILGGEEYIKPEEHL